MDNDNEGFFDLEEDAFSDGGEAKGDFEHPDGLVYDADMTEIKDVWDRTREEFIIAASVRKIELRVFSKCAALSAIVVEGDNAEYASSDDDMLFSKDMGTLLKVPPAKEGVCRIPAVTRLIAPEAFEECLNIKAFEVEEGSEWFRSEDGVLYDLWRKSLRMIPLLYSGKLTIPAWVRKIDCRLLSDYSGLTSLHIVSESVFFEVLDGALYTKGLKDMLYFPPGRPRACKVPAAVQRIGIDVFSTPGITAFEVEEGNASYRSVDGVLYDGELKELSRCPDHWPYSCLRVPEGVERIFGCACWGCIFLASIRLPASVNYIDPFLFMPQIGVSTITIDVDDGNAWYRVVDGVLFSKDMTELLRCPVSRSGEYRIPSTVRAIGNFSFAKCSLLTRIIVPASVEFEGPFAWDYVDAKIVREGAASNLFAAAADERCSGI